MNHLTSFDLTAAYADPNLVLLYGLALGNIGKGHLVSKRDRLLYGYWSSPVRVEPSGQHFARLQVSYCDPNVVPFVMDEDPQSRCPMFAGLRHDPLSSPSWYDLLPAGW
jgi:hypothetical protein